jgi:hypothetical protein
MLRLATKKLFLKTPNRLVSIFALIFSAFFLINKIVSGFLRRLHSKASSVHSVFVCKGVTRAVAYRFWAQSNKT